jgi:hypothetical protein
LDLTYPPFGLKHEAAMAGASNPDDDANLSTAPMLLGVIWSMSAASAIIMLLRLYTAVRVTRRVKLEDYLMLIAWVSLFVLSELRAIDQILSIVLRQTRSVCSSRQSSSPYRLPGAWEGTYTPSATNKWCRP